MAWWVSSGSWGEAGEELKCEVEVEEGMLKSFIGGGRDSSAPT